MSSRSGVVGPRPTIAVGTLDDWEQGRSVPMSSTLAARDNADGFVRDVANAALNAYGRDAGGTPVADDSTNCSPKSTPCRFNCRTAGRAAVRSALARAWQNVQGSSLDGLSGQNDPRDAGANPGTAMSSGSAAGSKHSDRHGPVGALLAAPACLPRPLAASARPTAATLLRSTALQIAVRIC